MLWKGGKKYLSIKSFHEIEERACDVEGDFCVAVVWPDEETIKMMHYVKNKGIADFIVVFDKKIQGFENIVVSNREEGLNAAIDFVMKGKAYTIMKGLINTSLFLKHILNSPMKKSWISHTSVLEVPSLRKLLIITDGTVTPYPNLEQKVEIIKNAVLCAKVLEIERPKVALLAANEWIVPSLPSTSDAALIVKMFERKQIPLDIVIDGPVSVDLALSNESSLKKKVKLSFDPPADVLIGSDLESSAFLIKSAVYLGKCKTAGILWGTVHPVVLTSRSDNYEARAVSLYIIKLYKKVMEN